MGRKSNVFVRLFKQVPDLVREPCFLEENPTPRKSALRRWAELTWYALIDRRAMFEYNACGCDRRGAPVSEVIRFWRDWKHCIVRPNHQYLGDWTVLLGNKFLFAAYCKAAGIRHVPVLAHIDAMGNCTMEGCRRSTSDLLTRLRTLDAFVVKPAEDCSGHGVRIVRDPASFSLSALETGREYIFQNLIVQHDGIANLNSSTVNTLRVLTCRDKTKTVFAPLGCAVVRIGRKGSVVDNISGGGVCCGCDEDGRLTNIAFTVSADERIVRVKRHPDHNYIFGGQQIPFYKEAVALCLEAHRCFRHVWVIGWDVVITADGPVLLEGNSEASVQTQIASQQGFRPQLRRIGLVR